MHVLADSHSLRRAVVVGVFSVASLVAVRSTAAAADVPLSREEISDGWVALFDGETLFGWQKQNDALAEVADGILELEVGRKGWLRTTSEFADFILRLDYRCEGPDGDCEVFLRCAREGDPRKTGVPLKFEPIKATDAWTRLEIRVDREQLIIRANGEPAADTEILSSEYQRAPRGVIGLAGTGKVSLRNLVLKPLGTEPIFNGKDLTGWAVLPQRQSVYSVTPEGWLNVKSGNGQIETEGQWDDLVLQLDIVSNGDHLNSGVFFRGDPGAFWSGYESQIRNEWLSDVILKDGTKLTGSYTDQGDSVSVRRCEDDGRRLRPTPDVTTLPKSDVVRVVHHRDRPVDFGTGAIYNRQATRKVVPNDREWFTKTIVAAGNHVAVWVDGYPVSDFTDTRPRGRNARTHQRLEAGPISLQGHDPTTDLSFRNLRVAPLPKRP